MLDKQVMKYIDFGHIEIKLGEKMTERGISIYQLNCEVKDLLEYKPSKK